MSNQLFLSIIIPIYNREKYIEDCLLSCLKQDLDKEKYEIIVVDDGSTDNSIKIVEQYVEKNNNIHLIKNQHKGVSVARNIGIVNAKGKYIWFVDSDDLIKSNCLKNLYLNFYSGEYDKIHFKGYSFNESELKDLNELSILNKKKVMTYWGYACTSIFRRDICLKYNIFFNSDILVGEDELFHVEYNLFIKTIVKEYADILYYYRKHLNQVMNNAFNNSLYRSMEIMKRVKYLTDKLRIDETYCKVIDFILHSIDFALRILVDLEEQKNVKNNLKKYKKMGVLPCKILYQYVDKTKVPTKSWYIRYRKTKFWNEHDKLKDLLIHPFKCGVIVIKKIFKKY